ncbi:alpha/beta fold hydrolase [Pseudomonas tolaasii]|uniref:alpha/beta fold hydrolase n=1 Tax=Pseudomonas tolaasii TaxID=29442 RepID=UPI0015A37F80|nr:alpha/beta hydrolase [Pseudomonas tolaasii]NVZ45956.1 alpha/beta fold hydrolase [Pseudomonas tolaasii]NWA49882.1 alpha/beta fold hydrolase [Pseudomonas tolaasii]
MTHVGVQEEIPLPPGIRARYIEGVNGLTMHVLEAGFSAPDRPCIVLLHGFPELAYSWRNVLIGLSEQGFHVIAPDQRGYGRTTGWSTSYDADLRSFYLLNLVRDVMALVNALGRRSIAAVVGHDFGSPVAAYCALVRPDIFHSVVLMSAPFDGPPPLVSGPVDEPVMAERLAALSPPKKHYQHYFCTREANGDLVNAPEGLPAFLRAYFHVKSGDWPGNAPSALSAWTPDELARMPSYYIMGLQESMPEAVRPYAPTADCEWLSAEDLNFFAREFQRTGFQGGLNWYRCSVLADHARELSLFAGRTIDVPSCFIYGEKDWGAFQLPGALQKMQDSACSAMQCVESICGAGHWVQQEKASEVVRHILKFLKGKVCSP